ncbi:hypothetical protein VT06_06825 [Arsukibacterium sp. MJ3]|uniref:hypothetical protein n=1 Tax=Arsukibacterium sp. MJ3 TaxID=1632859 RepID=UPI0006272F52|nr:hypothetical protein [Arsukibacterium sp. MJ3]KKO49535.1 hypothetical protein VT06_06825 [Arsukibacterium sp. MJ3]
MSQLKISRNELQNAFKENQHDVYALNSKEMTELWVAEQKSKGKTPQQITAIFEGLTETVLAKQLEIYGREFGGTVLAASSEIRMLNTLAMDMKRSGSIFGRYYVQVLGGKQYIIFKGRAGLRQILTGSRYLASNTKVMSMGVGGQALKSSAKGGFLISILFSVTINSLSWLFEDEYRWTDWLGAISADIVKAVIASAAGYAIGAIAATLTTIAVVPLTLGLIMAVGTAWFLYEVDQHFGITTALIWKLEQKEESLKRDIASGFYYVLSSTGAVVRRQLSLTLRSYLNSFVKPRFR